MAKIKAVLDQETWVAVDVPEEFQSIVISLSSTYSANGLEMPSPDGSSKLSYDESTIHEQIHSSEYNADNDKRTSATSHESKDESTSPQTEHSVLGNARSTSQTIVHGGVGYHMVNWLVIYIDRWD
jgi:vacuolar protein sorting-associated protein 54